MTREENIRRLLARNVETVIDAERLAAALRSGKKLRVKHGIDPTGENIHMGRAVVLWKLKEFQALGHTVVLVIGDFTAQIGDPSDKLEKRPFLTAAAVKQNLKNYLPQIGTILNLKKTEVRYNSEWLAKLNFRAISELADLFTFQQILERENFSVRLKNHEPIGLREGLYPLMQGYDSVAIRADVELGGTDQLFNLLAGRKIQERYGQASQDIMTTKMLLGTDNRKMSTSWGNVITIADTPEDMFGKVMAIHDGLIANYLALATDASEEKIKHCIKELASGRNPKELKEELAQSIVTRYHGAHAAKKAREEFSRVFSKKETPTEIPTLKLINLQTYRLIDFVIQAGIKSKGEARRLIAQGGVSINGAVCKNPTATPEIKNGAILKIGKRRFYRLKRS